MKLSKRLETILDMAKRWVSGQEAEGQNEICAADVGTDHGFVPICLVERGIVGRALALDVRTGPLLRAQEHVRERGLQERIELRLGDGLSPIEPTEAQLVILTGMGGELMLRILRENAQVRKSVRGFIFSPARPGGSGAGNPRGGDDQGGREILYRHDGRAWQDALSIGVFVSLRGGRDSEAACGAEGIFGAGDGKAGGDSKTAFGEYKKRERCGKAAFEGGGERS